MHPHVRARMRRAALAVLLVTSPQLFTGGAALADTGRRIQTPDIDFTKCTMPEVIVGSPSGQARSFTATLRNSSNQLSSVPAVWLGFDVPTGESMCDDGHAGPRPYTDELGDELDCSDPTVGHAIDWPYFYIQANPATFHPQFGGRGDKSLDVQAKLTPIPYYVSVRCIIARSTDFDSDGDTDQLDKLEIGHAIASGSPDSWYNLNTDVASNTVIDRDDYVVVAEEMLRDAHATCNCTEATDWEPDCFSAAQDSSDQSPPDTTSLFVSAQSSSDITLKWRSPGDDRDGSTKLGVPNEYDLRYADAPIDSAGFGTATRYTSTPSAPALAGGMETVTITGSCTLNRYWAIKTKDWAGNWSKVSACLDTRDVTAISTMTACATFRNCVLVGWEDAGAAAYDLRYSTSNITEANFCSATSGGTPSVSGGTAEKFINTAQGTTYYFAVRAKASNGRWSPISNVASTTTPTSGNCNQNVVCTGDWFSRIERPLADQLELANPNPSPTGSNTTIAYSIPEGADNRPLHLVVYSVTGRKVATLTDGTSKVGRSSVSWNLRDDAGRDVRAGVYFVRLTLGDQKLLRRVVVDPR